jgi:hypothetical protein
MARRLSPTHRKSFHERGQALANEFDDLFIAKVSLVTAAFFPRMLNFLPDHHHCSHECGLSIAPFLGRTAEKLEKFLPAALGLRHGMQC